VNKGSAQALTSQYMDLVHNGTMTINKKEIYKTLKQAVADFNALETHDRDLPKVGILGEIYVKYNDFGNHGVAGWLLNQDIEVVVPPLLEGFTGWFVTVKAQVESNLKRRNLLWLLSVPLYLYLQNFLNNVEKILQGYKHYHPFHSIKEVGEYARDIVSLNHQYGESWMIAGGVGSFVHSGVNNVLCLQPFGCIANHVVAKGVQNRMKEVYPDLNILFLDTDAGVSEVNFFNRMHFFVNHARETLAAQLS
jgi:predicted nucleotide-binding protein (sugar kinase/HSP70/actin superfamily)